MIGNLKFLIVFKSAGKNKIKIKEKREISTKSVLVFGVTNERVTNTQEIFTVHLYYHFLYTLKFSKYFDLF